MKQLMEKQQACMAQSVDKFFAMLLEAQRRGHRLHYVRPGGLAVRDGRAVAVAAPLRVREDPAGWHELGRFAELAFGPGQVVLMRKDPPVDAEYLYDTQILDLARLAGAQVVNDPRGLRAATRGVAGRLRRRGHGSHGLPAGRGRRGAPGRHARGPRGRPRGGRAQPLRRPPRRAGGAQRVPRVPERVKLVFGGKRLERGRPLADYGIKDESTLYLPDFTRCLPPPETLVHLMGNGNSDEQKEAASGVATFATIMSPQRFQSLATRPGLDAP